MPKIEKVMKIKKAVSVKKTVRGPAASVSRRASSDASLLAATRREPSSASPLTAKSRANLSIPAYSLKGLKSGEMTLPKEIFGIKVNKKLLSQAVRVYSTNQKQMLAKTKTRGEIKASKVKIYRQKGTGKARHGAISAPIFVGGGIVFGPMVRKIRLDLPTRMKKAALLSALSSKAEDKSIVGLIGAEKSSGKTKEIFELLLKINESKKTKSALIITGKREDNIIRGVKNIQRVNALSVNLLNAYEVLKHEMLLITKDAIEAFGPKERK